MVYEPIQNTFHKYINNQIESLYIYHQKKVKKLTVKESYRLMGFLDNFKLVGSKAKPYSTQKTLYTSQHQ
jgi:site-specific DNA-cytosine methylase